MEGNQLLRRNKRRHSGDTGRESSYSLPPELLETAVRRVGFIGLVCAVTAPAVFVTEHYLQPHRILSSRPVPFPLIVAVALFFAGMAVFMLTRSRKVPAPLMVDLGLIFEVVVAFGIALTEFAGPWPQGEPIRGISWNCLWIALFVVAVPAPYGKAVLAAVASALMAPIGLLMTTVVNQNPLPTPNQILLLLLPNFLAVAWATPVARYIHSLRAEVSKARAMGSYQLIERIGIGGMGEVWRAQHRLLARPAAIKLIRTEDIAAGEQTSVAVRRFEREAIATAALRSPHTVQLYDYGVSEDGDFYYVMELLEGMDLETLVDRFGPQTPARVIHLLMQACSSLAEAHGSGVTHRDIKPKNIFLCRLGVDYDFVKVLDFGLVKQVARQETTDSQLTVPGGAAGTSGYMAPELIAGGEVDGRTDLYALGCVGYWLLTDHHVFERDTPMAVAMAHMQTEPTPPSQLVEQPIPASLDAVILQCLQKKPADRPQTAQELYERLSACEFGELWTPERARAWWKSHIPPKPPGIKAIAAAEANTI